MASFRCSVLFLVVCLPVLILSSPQYTEKEQEYFANVKLQDLPREIRLKLVKSRRTGDTSHWCCKNDHDIHVSYRKQYATEMKFMVASTRIKSSDKSCGVFGSSRCSTYEIRYSEKPITHRTLKLVPVQEDCPDNMLICCNHYMNVAGECHQLSEVGDVLSFLKQMMDLGMTLAPNQFPWLQKN